MLVVNYIGKRFLFIDLASRCDQLTLFIYLQTLYLYTCRLNKHIVIHYHHKTTILQADYDHLHTGWHINNTPLKMLNTDLSETRRVIKQPTDHGLKTRKNISNNITYLSFSLLASSQIIWGRTSWYTNSTSFYLVSSHWLFFNACPPGCLWTTSSPRGFGDC